MAINPERIAEHQAEIVQFPLKQCGCGCGTINISEREWIYSDETDSYYADMVCFTKAVGADYDPSAGRIVIDDYEYTKEDFMHDYRAKWND